jgi:endonuclease/exonuclease/phosphatase family metal-dependent hydrolase
LKKSGFFVKVIFWLNNIAAFLLVVSFILPYLPPESFPNLSLLSLTVSPLILLNVIFAIYWVIRKKRKALLSICVLILTYFLLSPIIKFSTERSSEDFKNSVNLMSFNVHLFNSYEENSNKNVSEIFKELLLTEQPDIICIQEYYRDNIPDLTSYPYQYIHFKETTNKKGVTKENVLGHAILSKYPIVATGAFDFSYTYNNSIYADVVIENDTIRVYNLHLKSMSIIPSVSFLQGRDKEKLRKRLSNAFVVQQEQVETILAHKRESPYPALVGGDFNNTPFSYIYKKFKNEMTDAYSECGNGLGTTYSFDFYPMRIDYIFTSEEFEVLKFKAIKKTFSDHYPVSATMGWNKRDDALMD